MVCAKTIAEIRTNTIETNYHRLKADDRGIGGFKDLHSVIKSLLILLTYDNLHRLENLKRRSNLWKDLILAGISVLTKDAQVMALGDKGTLLRAPIMVNIRPLFSGARPAVRDSVVTGQHRFSISIWPLR